MILRREVGSTVERLAVWSKKSRKGPAALSGKGADCDLITAVDIWTLVAVYFYRDVIFVNDLCDFGIVVGFAIHDVAPVTPHCTNVEQDGFVVSLGSCERLFAPFVPLDGLVHRRAQVGRDGAGEGVMGGGGHLSSLSRS